jgi:hypothetical protein
MANDFTGDANCKALWRFENNALDSVGGNDWQADGGSPQWDAVTFKEGAYSVDMLGKTDGDSYLLSDAGGDLDAGYPFKNGDANKKMSICSWIQFQSAPSGSGTRTAYCYEKGGGSTMSFHLSLSYTTNSSNWQIGIGINGGTSFESVQHASNITDASLLGNWYHIGATYDDSDKSYRIRVWDDNAQAILGSDQTGTMSNNINIENGAVHLNESPINTQIGDVFYDEMVIFDDILTADEIDEIRKGAYGTQVGPKFHHYQQAGGL